MQLVWLLLTSLSFHFAFAELPGICIVKSMVTKHRHAFNRTSGVWNVQSYNETVDRKQCCEGYRPTSLSPLTCSPICEPECTNSDCMAPNICVCHPGHQLDNNSTNTCYDVCDSCVNGACFGFGDQQECTCYPNYERDETFQHICNPICSPQCINSTCTAPGICKCFQGFYKKLEPDNVCTPKCNEVCVFGECTEPEICTCFEGYINDMSSPSICLPVCDHTCENGDCAAPNSCKCRDGYELHPRNPFHCVPELEHSSLNFCELKMPKAVRYDKAANCFVMKDKVMITGDAQCRLLQGLSQPSCSQPSVCGLSECILNFRCSTKKLNGTNEIHCYLEKDDFETDTSVTSITPSTEWTDITLVVNSFQLINSSSIKVQNQTRQWSLHPLSKTPVCGKMHFAVEISGCGPETLGVSSDSHVNSSLMVWINVFLITGFLLLVGAGVGGFLWARHRKLHDPLNYRENMMSGYYNNESYERPAELVPDDESEHESDAPL